MIPALVTAFLGAIASVAAFPPLGPGLLVVTGVALFLVSLRLSGTRQTGFWAGGIYGLVFFGGLMWWLAELDPLALALIPVQALFFAIYGWWLVTFNHRGHGAWLVLAVGWWAVMELIRYHFPVGGQEWGAVGYALSDNLLTRLPASLIGTSGLTVLVVLVSSQLALAVTARSWRWWLAPLATVALIAALTPLLTEDPEGAERQVAIVQGSTPCPFERCPPNQRFRTFQQHLGLTESIEPGTVELVVWPESSTGSTNADPVLNEEVGAAIAAQAERVGAPILVGGDRTVSDDEFINANVFFDEKGRIVGEYRKQHPVPFGEFIPWRPLFEWIPALDRVPRDMVRGEGPVVFGLGETRLGSVISWEGGFSRYALQHRRAGANLLAVTTNKASYGPDAPTSDQFIGMTRMRAVELGVPVIHAAVTGKSTVIDRRGSFRSTTPTGDSVVFYGDAGPSSSTVFTTTGNLVMYLAALAGVTTWILPLGSARADRRSDR